MSSECESFALSGIVVSRRSDGLIIKSDPAANFILGMPPEIVALLPEDRPIPHLVDIESRPIKPGSFFQQLGAGVPFATVKAIRWGRAWPWKWFNATSLLHEDEASTIISTVRPSSIDVKVTVSTCDRCGAISLSHAACKTCGRDLCIQCWTFHGCAESKERVEDGIKILTKLINTQRITTSDQERFVDAVAKTKRYGFDVLTCPDTGSRLRRDETGGISQLQLESRCAAHETDEPCHPGCIRSLANRWLWAGSRELKDV